MNFTDRKENWKLYWVVAIFVLLGIALVSVSYVGERVQAGVNGYISGEAQWSKAQKNATLELVQYVRTGDEDFYEAFSESLNVIYGNRIAREELSKENPNLEKASEGFLQGKNHPDEIGAMIWVFKNFRDSEKISTAIQIWEKGDDAIDQLVDLAESLRERISNTELTEAEIEQYYRKISELDRILTELEEDFSIAMGDAGRWTGNAVFWTTSILSVVLIFIAAFTVFSIMRGYKTAIEKLRESELKFKNVLDHSRDVIYQIKIGSEKYDYMSSSVEDMLGFSAEEVMEGGPLFILERTHPEDLDRMTIKNEQLKSEAVEEKLTRDTEFRVKGADGEYIWVNNKRSLLRDENGESSAIVGNVRDISVRKRQMEKLDKSLVEKQTLLAEIHHRVKNNLAIVSSLIELQKEGVDSVVKSSFREIQTRIKSIALIHEKLYENTIFSEVDLSVYLEELAEMISSTYQSSQKKINIVYNLAEIKVEMTIAVPIGLICNELINNCFKHAFSESEKGDITVSLYKKNSSGVVVVSDNGKGLPGDFSLNNTSGLGITLLNVLTDQINGELTVEKGGKTTFELKFPLSTENEKTESRPA